jgi:Arc/MetJ-type ribon-helix-helix transcriptional regulator
MTAYFFLAGDSGLWFYELNAAILCLTVPALSATLGLGVRRSVVTVHLPPKIERIVNDAVRSGQYGSAEEVLSEAVSVWQARQTTAAPTNDERQAAIERLKGFGKTHQLSLGGITIKQLRDEARP